MKRLVVAAVAVLLLSGCASAPAKSPAQKPKFAIGASATAIANAVKACKDVTQNSVPASATDLASLATCKINGAPVQFYSWKTVEAAASTEPFGGPDGAEYYYAASKTWSTLPMVEGDIPGQKAVAEAIVKSIGGRVVHFTS